MAAQKSNDRKNVQHDTIDVLTPRTFVRAAGLANMVVAGAVLFEFCAIALFKHDGLLFLFGLAFIPIVTVMIWATAAVLGFVVLTPGRLWMIGQRLTGTSRSLTLSKSRLWDDWLDGPELHDSLPCVPGS